MRRQITPILGELAHELTYDATGSILDEAYDVATVIVAWIAAMEASLPKPEIRCKNCGDVIRLAHDDDWIHDSGFYTCANGDGFGQSQAEPPTTPPTL